VKISVICVFCGIESTIEVDDYGYYRWLEGVHIQDALPQLTSDQRELLISHTCGKCYDKMFGEDG